MITILEEILKEKTAGTTSEILYSQWVFDKQLIPGALSEISNIFPHYSLHDQSHSIAIINNIIRVIGKENIASLSAIDIWLILQAAYYHDTGMVLSGVDLLETINHKKFIAFFESLLEDSSHSLHRYAKKFEIKEDRIHLKSTIQDVSVQEGFKYILAEYFRKIHSQRSEKVVNDPDRELSLKSPRSIIPKRIWNVLGRICSLHTADFDEVMGLPFNMVGIDIEDAHPRLIASLLRIGDLLDLDNNRFSEVMLKTLTQVPVDTMNHKEKHLSVEVFSVSNELINITAKCKDYDSATLAHHWFSYLRSEISNQTLFWNKIAPSTYLITLPSIESLKVVLKDYKYIENGKRPCFSISSRKALNIIQGANIYSNGFQALREILQNATDATLLRVWLDICADGEELKMKTPNKDFYSRIEKLPITINIYKSELGEDDTYTWTIAVVDQGIGLSYSDIKHLLQSNSNENNEKKQLIRSMPKWMQPSGIFGIGFQSAFLLCERIQMTTKSYQTQEFHELTFYSPSSRFNGDVYINERSTSFSEKPGTILKLEYKTKRIPDSFVIPAQNKRAEKVANNYDPFLSDSMDVGVMKIIDEIEKFSYHSILQINVNFEDQTETLNSLDNVKSENFDQETGIAFNVWGVGKGYDTIDYFFKNQPVENGRFLSFPFLNLQVNFMHGPASKVLELNRSTFLSSFVKEIRSDAYKVITQYLSNNINKRSWSPEEKNYISLAIEYQNIMRGLKINSHDLWKKLDLCEGFKLGSLDTITKLEVEIVSNRQMNGYDNFKFKNGVLILSISEYSSVNPIHDFFLQKVLDNKEQFFEVSEFKERKKQILINGKKETVLTTFFVLTKYGSSLNYLPNDVINYMLVKFRSTMPLFARNIIPCPKDFPQLRIKDSSRPNYVGDSKLHHSFTPGYAKMIAPFKSSSSHIRSIRPRLEVSIPDSLIEWVFQNRFDRTVTKEQIRHGYSEYIDTYKNLLR